MLPHMATLRVSLTATLQVGIYINSISQDEGIHVHRMAFLFFVFLYCFPFSCTNRSYLFEECYQRTLLSTLFNTLHVIDLFFKKFTHFSHLLKNLLTFQKKNQSYEMG